MAITQSSTVRARQASSEQGTSLPDLLRLLGAGASGSILQSLREKPLRTKDLTTRVPGFTPRTIYRYVGRLGEIGAIERREEPGVPSKVVQRLTDPCGVELCELVDRFARTSLQVLADGGVVPHSWGGVTLLADLWESGMYKELNTEPCTATELARVSQGLSFHQVSRRINLFVIAGLVRETNGGSRRRRYELTDQARKGTGLIAGLGGWRERYVVAPGEAGLTLDETVEVVKGAAPLVVLPEHAGQCFELNLASPESVDGDEDEVVWVELGPDGRAVARLKGQDDGVGWARGEVGDWIEALVRGDSGVRCGGAESATAEACLHEMHAALWTRAEDD